MKSEIEALREEVCGLKEAVMLLARIKGGRLSSSQLVERVGRTRQTIMSMVRRGDFPAPCKDGHWLLEEVMEWEKSKR
jgi:predicted DNA-binding transcriptional regulator AlpA